MLEPDLGLQRWKRVNVVMETRGVECIAVGFALCALEPVGDVESRAAFLGRRAAVDPEGQLAQRRRA